ncbi:MAG: non-heme iron oxygenase ferredoxin subunit [Betaproteobacteria bacterium]|nr:non-heme iron oxygenase ferredoxin subunit [Betaproteobacteria bacterium]
MQHYSEFHDECNFTLVSDTNRRRVRAAAESEIPDDSGLAVKVGDTAIALFRVAGRCYAISNVCPHRGGPLAEGDLEGHVVHCPWHGWAWDVRTGANVRQPASKVACFAVSIEDGSVFVDIGPNPATL